MNSPISMFQHLNDFDEYFRTKVEAFVDSFHSLKDWSLDSIANEHPLAIACVLICIIVLFGNWMLNKKYPEEIRDKKNDYIIPIAALIFSCALIGLSEIFWPLKSAFHALSMLKLL